MNSSSRDHAPTTSAATRGPIARAASAWWVIFGMVIAGGFGAIHDPQSLHGTFGMVWGAATIMLARRLGLVR